MGTKLGRDLGTIGHDVQCGFIFGTKRSATWVGPDHNCKTTRSSFRGSGADLLEHLILPIGSRIDGVADRDAAQLKRIAYG